MSLGSVSRARAMFNSVMAKKGCRVVLIALVMFVCGNLSMFAQLANGDTITIRYNGSNNYLAVNNNNSLTYYSGDKPTVECLWIVTIDGDGYSFESVSLKNKNVTNRKLQGQDGTTLQLGGTGSTFGLGTNGDVTNVANQVTGRFYYMYTQDGKNRYRFIQYNSGWSMTDYRYKSGGSNKNPKYTNYDADSEPDNTLLLLEKWTRKEVKGGMTGSFSSSEGIEFKSEGIEFKNFDKTDVEARTHATRVNFVITRTAATAYYQCVNRADATISISSSTQNNNPIELSLLSVSWQFTSNSTTSKADCSNYENAAVTSRALLEYTRGETSYTNNAQTITLPITITPVGSSPMEMKSADGTRWADHTDNLVVAFRDKDDVNETTYRVSLPVTRYSYHKEELPELEVSVNPTSDEFPRKSDEPRNYTFTCVHQHGVVIAHMYNKDGGGEGATEGLTSYIYDQARTELSIIEDSDPLTATFSLKNTNDETNASWGIALGGITDNVLSLTAPANTTGLVRTARLVGTFTYADGDDTHTKVIVVPITQNAKDGSVKFHHQKGYYNTEFGKNTITGAAEQQVHTAEKTIYYLPNETIALVLAEPRFTAYQRWYDYETDGDPQWNLNASDRITWVRKPTGTDINPQEGNSFGIYNRNSDAYDPESRNDVIPKFKAWNYTDIEEAYHTLACDLSHYTDLDVSSTDITEPTLSYRQLWHFRPAKEMAAKLDTCVGDTYLETHYYTAPTGTDIYLATDYHHSLNKTFNDVNIFATQNSYFYDANNPKRIDAENLTWYSGNTTLTKDYDAKDFQTVSSTTVGTITYYLRASVDGKTLNIAKFVVNYVDKSKHGPTTTQIISRDTIVNKYDVLAEIDFNYEPLPTNATTNTQFYRPLPWGESTYGYYYPSGGLANDNHSNRSSNIPYYGEYALLNYMNASWATGTAHGGGTTGYALFVDGTTEPGLVASISTDAVVCSGQTMYCSMWLLNPRKSGQTSGASNPIFRCNIQGRNSGDTEWHNVGTYFVGEIVGGGQPWHQVVFPIESEISYDETRVQIYNFGEGGNGNDFMVDDICLYASPLPLATYHQTTGCTSYADDETTSTVVVVRIDYSQLEFASNTVRNVYYQIVDITDSIDVVELTDANGNSLYYHESNDDSHEYGSISIPTKVETSLQRSNVEVLIDELTAPGSSQTSGKCFVQDAITKKWYLYVVQTIPNGDGGDRNQYLDRDRKYILRVSYDATQLDVAECVFTSSLYAKQDTYIQLRNNEVDSMRVTSCLGGLCANNHHFLDVKVSNAISSTVGGTMQTYEALVHADWLRGYEEDDVYCDKKTATANQLSTADDNFSRNYGYSRTAVKSAIVDMRRVPSSTDPNPNYTVADPNQLQVSGDFDENDLALIRDLCNKGLLQLYKKTIMFYLGSEASARYWVYPVAENATVSVEGKEYLLQDCDEPKWVKVTSARSEYGVNLSPIEYGNQTEHQRLDIPTIRVSEGTEEITIPIKQLLGNTKLNSTLNAVAENIVFKFNEPIDQVLEYVDISNNMINIMDAPTRLEPGREYLMRMAFYDKDGNAYIGGDTTQCRVGHVYFYVMAVPLEMTWTGEKSTVWGDDANWDGGCAPLATSRVIIPANVRAPILDDNNNQYPMDVNYSSNVCDKIYFEPGAMIGNQHLLQYNQAFVDMRVTATTWHSMAAPMQGMYSGDMYVPHSGNYSSGTNLEYKNTTDNNQYPFVVNSFQGARSSSAAFAFWQSIYNKRVPTYHENGNQSYPSMTSTEQFVQTNSLGYELKPGTGYQLLGYGPTDEAVDLIIRLPKPDTYYSYYTNKGEETDQRAYVTHSPKLAFTPDANGNMRITLTNDVASNKFMFGNPTMANINMKEFLQANADVVAAYYVTMDNSSWNAKTLLTNGENKALLPPMRSAMLQLKDGMTATSITLTLSANHLEAGSEVSDVAENMPARRQAPADEASTQVMNIYSYSNSGSAHCVVAAAAGAKDTYDSNEDVLFFSSGVEEGVNSATATSPVNMYTVSEQVPMMVDVREKIDTVPLSMLVHKSYRTEKVKFSFYLSLNWDKECYFCDAVTGARYRILDGLVLEMDMPQNHEVRYFIDGPDVIDPDNGGDIWSSTEDIKTSDMQVWAYSPSQGELVVASNDIIKEVTVYDIAGRVIAHQTLNLQYSSMTIATIPGVCIVETTMRDNTKHYTQTVVR